MSREQVNPRLADAAWQKAPSKALASLDRCNPAATSKCVGQLHMSLTGMLPVYRGLMCTCTKFLQRTRAAELFDAL
jgi:hypothetical protein